MRDVLIVLGCVVFVGALMGSIASIAGVSNTDATGPIGGAALAGAGLGLVLTLLLPSKRR